MPDRSYTPPEVRSVLGFVDTFLRWRNEQSKGERSYKYYHPSEFGKCLRKAQYKLYAEMGFIDVKAEVLDSQKIRLFDKGHNMHERWQNYFVSMGVLRGKWRCRNPACHRIHGKFEKLGIFYPKICDKCDSTEFDYREVRVEDEELNFGGNVDLILDFSQVTEDVFDGVRKAFKIENLPKKPIVLDMKTTNDNQFRSQVKAKGPHKEYVVQLSIYVHLLDCEYGMIVYENKNNSEIAAFQIKRDDKKFAIIAEQAGKLKRMTESKKLPPPRPRTKSDYECKYCEFAPHCHKTRVWEDPKLDEKRDKFYQELL